MEEKDDKTPEQEYEAEFDKLSEGNDPAPEASPKQEEVEPEEKPEEKKPDEAAPEGKKPSEEPKVKEQPEPKPESEEGKGVAKALKDTKAWATKVSQENAELKRLNEQLRAGKATQEQVDDAKAKVGETRKALDAKLAKVTEDYPELKDVLDPLVDIVDTLTGEVKNLKSISDEEKRILEKRNTFEAEVAPEIAKVHEDWKQVAFSPEYMEWVKTQPPAIQNAAMNSLDPRDIAYTITEFKKFKVSPEAAKAKDEEAKRKDAVKENLSSVRGGGPVNEKGRAKSLSEVDKNDYDSAWELASKEK
jgi:hypothetical protein